MSQSWNATHQQIDGGKMDGFVRSVENDEPMGYWTEEVLPFAYSLARTFTRGQPAGSPRRRARRIPTAAS